jgi:hypothetical protein
VQYSTDDGEDAAAATTTATTTDEDDPMLEPLSRCIIIVSYHSLRTDLVHQVRYDMFKKMMANTYLTRSTSQPSAIIAYLRNDKMRRDCLLVHGELDAALLG